MLNDMICNVVGMCFAAQCQQSINNVTDRDWHFVLVNQQR